MIQAAVMPTIKVVTEQWPPYNYLDADGNFKGIATDIVIRTLEHAEVNYDINLYAWNKSFKLAKDNENTLLFTIYRLKQRENQFQWICPLIETGDVNMYTLKERNDIKVTSLEDAKNYIIGTVGTGSTYDHLIANGFKVNVHLDIGSDELANIKKLLAGRIDVVIQQSDLLTGRIERLNSNVKRVKPIFKLENQGHKLGCMAMSKSTSPFVVEKIRKSLHAVLTEEG